MAELLGLELVSSSEGEAGMFVRPFSTGRLLATGRVLHRGRRLGLTEAHVRDAEGRLVAHATSTCMVVPPAG